MRAVKVRPIERALAIIAAHNDSGILREGGRVDVFAIPDIHHDMSFIKNQIAGLDRIETDGTNVKARLKSRVAINFASAKPISHLAKPAAIDA